jgi:hypothetical protein
MPIYAITATHPVATCPIFNEEVKKNFSSAFAKREEAAKKHRVKVLVACAAVLEHVIFYVVDAYSQPDVEEYLKEIGMAAYNNIRIREVTFIEDTTKRYGLT